jgi:hypothetical protein
MRGSSTIALCLLTLSSMPTTAVAQEAANNTLTAKERAAGWKLLFDGRDLKGWTSYNGGAPSPTWTIRDGALELTATSGTMSGGDLVTADRYGAFELTLDWKVAPGGNSGVLYLARNLPQTKQVYETGALYDITVPKPGVSHPAGQWNHARLLVEKGRIRQWLNGTMTADVSYGDDAWRKRVAGSKFAKMPYFGTFDSGVIALQDHGEPVAFRDIKLRPIGPSATAIR